MGLDSCCPSTPPSPPSPTPHSTARLLLETASVCAARTARLLCSRLLLALRRSAHRQPTRAPAAPDARIVAMRRDDEPRAVMRGYARLRAVTAMMSGYERLQRRRAVRGNSGRVLSEHLLRYVRYSVQREHLVTSVTSVTYSEGTSFFPFLLLLTARAPRSFRYFRYLQRGHLVGRREGIRRWLKCQTARRAQRRGRHGERCAVRVGLGGSSGRRVGGVHGGREPELLVKGGGGGECRGGGGGGEREARGRAYSVLLERAPRGGGLARSSSEHPAAGGSLGALRALEAAAAGAAGAAAASGGGAVGAPAEASRGGGRERGWRPQLRAWGACAPPWGRRDGTERHEKAVASKSSSCQPSLIAVELRESRLDTCCCCAAATLSIEPECDAELGWGPPTTGDNPTAGDEPTRGADGVERVVHVASPA